MAYNPDGTFERLGHISRKAGQMYLFFCQWRDHKTGYSRKNFDTGCAELGLSRATAYRVRNELVEGDWISLDASGRVGLRGGDFKCKDRTPAATLVWQDWKDPYSADSGESSNELQTKCATGLSVETERLNTETDNLKPETKNLKVETAHIKERARGSSSTLSSTLSSTHTPASRGEHAGDDAPAARVCVELAFEDYIGYGKSEPGIRNARGWAMAVFPKRDPNVEKYVREWKEKSELTRAGRAAVEQQRTPYHVAAPPTTKCDHTCPRCFGIGLEVVPGRGARKCPGGEMSDKMVGEELRREGVGK